jgi:hypothetical protein
MSPAVTNLWYVYNLKWWWARAIITRILTSNFHIGFQEVTSGSNSAVSWFAAAFRDCAETRAAGLAGRIGVMLCGKGAFGTFDAEATSDKRARWSHCYVMSCHSSKHSSSGFTCKNSSEIREDQQSGCNLHGGQYKLVSGVITIATVVSQEY